MKGNKRHGLTTRVTDGTDAGEEGADLDLGAILGDGGSLERLAQVPEKERPAALRAYIRSELRSFGKRAESLAAWGIMGAERADGLLLAQRECGLLGALELASEQGLDTLVQEAAPALDTFLREKLCLWERLEGQRGAVPASATLKERFVIPYFEALASLRALGYALPDDEAARLILDGLEEAMRDEASAFGYADRRERIMYFDHRRIERAADLIGFLEGRGATAAPAKEALLTCLCELFIFPEEHHTYSLDYYPSEHADGRVVLISEDAARSTMKGRFALLGRLEKRGYAIEFQKVAGNYCAGLHAEMFLAEKGTGAMGACARDILSQLAWLEGKGADLREVYRGLREETVRAVNSGEWSVRACLPLLDSLAERGAFDGDSLAFLKATTYK